MVWREWRVCSGHSKKERFREHNGYKHSIQPSLSSVVEKSKEMFVKAKESEAESIRRQVVPLVDVVSLCATQELAMIKVDPIARLLEKHNVSVTPYWRSKNYPFVFLRAGAELQFLSLRDFGSGMPFGITVDETTDVAVEKQLIAYIKVAGESRFMGLVNVQSGASEELMYAMVKLINDRGFDIRNIACFSSDGASTMVGSKTGLKVRLDRHIRQALDIENVKDGSCLFFNVHCVCHRVNLAVDDVFKKEWVEKRVCELADKIEIVIKYCYNFFSRSPDRRKEYKSLINTFSRITLPGAWCDTRWLSRFSAVNSVTENTKAIVHWATNSHIKTTHEAQFVIASLTDKTFLADLNTTRRALRALYRLSIRLQYDSQSPWNAYLVIERAITQLEDVYEDADNSDDEMDESAGKALTKQLMLSVQRRFPMDEGKLVAIYDLRVLRPSDDSGAENYFPKSLVDKSIKWHLESFFRFYAAYGDKIEVGKILIRVHRSLCKAAHQRDIYDIFKVQKTLTLDKPDQSILKVFIDILGSFSSDSAVAERGFSTLNRIRTKTRNRLGGENLEAAMSMSLNPVPESEDIVQHWQNLKIRRRKALKPTKIRPVNVHRMTLEELDELDDEDFSEDEKDMEDIQWENAEEEISEGELEFIRQECEAEISLKIGLEGSEVNETPNPSKRQKKT